MRVCKRTCYYGGHDDGLAGVDVEGESADDCYYYDDDDEDVAVAVECGDVNGCYCCSLHDAQMLVAER